MKTYYVNNLAQPNGNHEVHHLNCNFFLLMENKTYLGIFSNCKDAVKEVKKYHNQVNGCFYCSKECHTQ